MAHLPDAATALTNAPVPVESNSAAVARPSMKAVKIPAGMIRAVSSIYRILNLGSPSSMTVSEWAEVVLCRSFPGVTSEVVFKSP